MNIHVRNKLKSELFRVEKEVKSLKPIDPMNVIQNK